MTIAFLENSLDSKAHIAVRHCDVMASKGFCLYTAAGGRVVLIEYSRCQYLALVDGRMLLFDGRADARRFIDKHLTMRNRLALVLFAVVGVQAEACLGEDAAGRSL